MILEKIQKKIKNIFFLKKIIYYHLLAGYENGHIYNSVKERQQVAAYEFAMKHNIFRTAHAGEAVGPSSIQNVSKSLNFYAAGLDSWVRTALKSVL